jgi:hypothetical protein
MRLLLITAVAGSGLYVVVAAVMAMHVTFYWDDYFLLLTLDDRGLGGALLTGINGNWWPLATLGLWIQLAVFGATYPAYIAMNAALVVASAWAAWFALTPLARRRPWLLAAALAIYACSLGLVVNVTVMTMSWPLAAALAMTAAALVVRGRPAWAWGSVLALAFLAESGLFAVLATTVGAILVVTRAAARGWTRPPGKDVLLAAALVVAGIVGTGVGFVIARADPIDYYARAEAAGSSGLGGADVGQLVHDTAVFVPAWLAAPLLAPVVLLPKALPWLVVLLSTYRWALTVAVLGVAGTVGILWRHRQQDPTGAERWARLLAALVLAIPVVETALILGLTRGGSGLAPRYAILWLLPAAAGWAVLLQCRPAAAWLRAARALASILLVVSAVTAVVALPWTFRSAFDIDKARWERSPNQVSQLERCRTEGVGVADQQVSPGLRDDLLCQVVDFLDGR